MLTLNHKNLEVWKESIKFISNVYRLTENFPKSEIYGITNQIRRAAVSVASNIAEGASRTSPIERKRFYEISRFSLAEIDTQLEIAVELNYSKSEHLTQISEQMNSIFAKLSNLILKTR